MLYTEKELRELKECLKNADRELRGRTERVRQSRKFLQLLTEPIILEIN